MNRIKFLSLLLLLNTILVLTESCDKAGESCTSAICQNGGECIEGICECLDGYIGTNCESNIQTLLDNGMTPQELFNEGIILEDLYGRAYKGGIIFYYNEADGTGMVASKDSQTILIKWGCAHQQVMFNRVPYNNAVPEGPGAEIGYGKVNTDTIVATCDSQPDVRTAAKLCREQGENWFLPSIKELNLMYTNLHLKGHGSLANGLHWSSTELEPISTGDVTSAWCQSFITGTFFPYNKSDPLFFRAVRFF